MHISEPIVNVARLNNVSFSGITKNSTDIFLAAY